MSISLSKKTSLSRSALDAYLRKDQCDLRHAVFTDFYIDFAKFLSDKQGKNYTPGTVREILRTLRKYIRSAISEGFVPNIDIIPSAIDTLNAQIWPDAKPDPKKAAYINRQDLRVTDSVTSIMRSLDAWSTKQRMGIPSKSSDRNARDEALEKRCTAIYLFCLLTCGIEIKDALTIKRDWTGPEIPDTVYVHRFGARLSLSPTAKKLVGIYNQGSECTDHLFFTLDNKIYKADPDNAARLIQDRIVRYLNRQSIPLFLKRTVFIDWLNYAIENGLPDAEAESLWRNHLGDAQDAGLAASAVAQSILGNASGNLDESWYLLSIIPLSLKRDRFLRILLSSGIFGEENEAKKRIYVPEDRFRDKLRGDSAVFTRYIFFRGTRAQAQFANSFSPYAYVIKDAAKTRFAQIPTCELEDLQIMLRDFPDGVQLIDGQKWLNQHNAQIVPGCKAIIRSGSLIGKEAKIVRIKGKKTSAPTYFIEYIHGNITFSSSLTGISLDLITTNN